MRTRILAFLVLSTAFAAMADRRTSYVFKRGDRSHMHANGSIDTAVRVSKKYTGDYIWVRQDGREYLIRDAAVLAEANAAFRELDAFEPVVREAERKVKPYEDQMEDLEEHMDEISDKLDDEDLAQSAVRDLEAKLHDFEEKVHGIEAKLRGLEEDLEKVEDLMDAREEVAERKLETIINKAIRNGSAARAE